MFWLSGAITLGQMLPHLHLLIYLLYWKRELQNFQS